MKRKYHYCGFTYSYYRKLPCDLNWDVVLNVSYAKSFIYFVPTSNKVSLIYDDNGSCFSSDLMTTALSPTAIASHLIISLSSFFHT